MNRALLIIFATLCAILVGGYAYFFPAFKASQERAIAAEQKARMRWHNKWRNCRKNRRRWNWISKCGNRSPILLFKWMNRIPQK